MQQLLRIRKKILFFAFICSAPLLFVFCQKAIEKTGGMVVIGISADFDSLNELNAADTDALQVIQNMLFMTLTRLDSSLNFIPYLAERWEFSADNTVLTYHLRRDVFWSDGAPTTADDVIFTYEAATNPDIAYPASSRFDLVDSVVQVDDFTVSFYLAKAYPDVLFDTQIPILPQHILGKLTPDEILASSFNRNPIGNGPFVLAEWQANQAIIFKVNDNYVFGRPNLDRVIFSIIPDENILFTNLRTGAVDVVPRITPDNLGHVQSKDIEVRAFPGKGFTFIGWNLERPFLTRPVRQAFTSAINKNEIITTLLHGYGIPAVGPLTPLAWAFDHDLKDIPFDPDKAKILLAQEGWLDSDNDGVVDKNGEPLKITLKVNVGSQLRQDVAVMVQAQLKNIGVDVAIQRVDWNLFIDQVFQQHDFDAVVLAWDTDFTVNPTDLWHSDAIANGYNFVSYANPAIDALLEQGRNATGRASALPIWQQLQEIILSDSPYTFLFIPDNIVAYNKRLTGCIFDLRSLYVNVSEWRIQ